MLGEGSVFVSGRLGEYLDGLRRLRALELEVICPGHGDGVDDPAAKLDEYLAHRAERERKLLAALRGGRATEDELLDAAWADAPAAVRPFAAITLRAHLEKLRAEGLSPRLRRSRPSSSAARERRGAGGGGASRRSCAACRRSRARGRRRAPAS